MTVNTETFPGDVNFNTSIKARISSAEDVSKQGVAIPPPPYPDSHGGSGEVDDGGDVMKPFDRTSRSSSIVASSSPPSIPNKRSRRFSFEHGSFALTPDTPATAALMMTKGYQTSTNTISSKGNSFNDSFHDHNNKSVDDNDIGNNKHSSSRSLSLSSLAQQVENVIIDDNDIDNNNENDNDTDTFSNSDNDMNSNQDSINSGLSLRSYQEERRIGLPLGSGCPGGSITNSAIRCSSILDSCKNTQNLIELHSADASQSKGHDKKPPLEHRRSLLLTFSFITATLSAGLVYGWPALRRSLITNEQSTLTESQLGLIFTVGSWSAQGGRFFAGLARDRISGTRVTACVCLLVTLGGVVGIALCGENNAIGLAISMFCMGIGSGATLCLQPVAGLFPLELQGSILATIGGLDQSSGVIFLLLIAISTNRRESFGPFAVVLGLILLVAYRMLPKEHFVKWEAVKENDIEDESSSENKDAEDYVDSSDMSTEDSISNYVAPMDMPNVVDQIKSNEYFLLLLWFSTQLIPLQYYVATIGFQLERKGDEDGTYTNVFTLIFVASAIVSPLIGKFIDTTGLGIAQGVSTILSSVSLVFLGLRSVPLGAHVFGMCCYSVARTMTFTTFFTNLGKRFGFTNYGTLAGLGLIVSAIVSLLQYPLISLAATGDVNLVNFVSALTAVGLGLPYCFWLWRREKAEQKEI